MRGRVLAWVGGAVAVAAAVVLGVYFAVEGLGKADKVASVAGTFIGLAGLVVSVYGIYQARREARGSSGPAVGGCQSVTGTRTAGVSPRSCVLRAASAKAARPRNLLLHRQHRLLLPRRRRLG